MKPKKFLCDFCNESNPAWDYPCRTFMAMGGVVESLDSWVACESCHDLIEAGNWPGLAERASNELGWPPPMCAEIHREFRQHRTGQPKRYGTG